MGKRVLFISETIVMPVERGNRKRAFNLINSFREAGCEVDYLYLETYDNEDPAPTREWIGEDHFHTFRNKRRSLPVFLKRKVRKVLEILHIPFIFRYYSVDEAMNPGIDAFMRDFLKERHYDVMVASYIYNSRPLIFAPEGCVTAIDTNNAFTFKRQMYDDVGYYNYQFALKKEEEAKGLSRADWVIAIQEEEEAFFKTIVPGSRHCTIGENMPKTEAYVAEGRDVLFLGSYYVVNREGVNYFIKNIWPKVKAQVPDARFKIAGSICKHVPDSDQYLKLGFVDDVGECYRSSRVVINPVHYGTGLNIKTIEALSYAKPLVSYEVGIRGLNSERPIAMVAADDDGYAEAVVRLLTDDEKAMELSKNTELFLDEYREKNTRAIEDIINGD